jgi:TetR/AcrR family transcriptional regulator
MNTTEEKIIQAAIKEFSEFGYEGARIDRIAKKSKVNKAMIYYHFKNKEKLYESIILFHVDIIAEFIQNIIPDGKANIEHIYTLISRFIDFFEQSETTFLKLMLQELSGGGMYFRKLVIPRLIIPTATMINKTILSEIDEKHIRPIDPYNTFLMVIGAIIYFNTAKIVMQDTELHNMILNKDNPNAFRDNLIEILKHGIEL